MTKELRIKDLPGILEGAKLYRELVTEFDRVEQQFGNIPVSSQAFNLALRMVRGDQIAKRDRAELFHSLTAGHASDQLNHFSAYNSKSGLQDGHQPSRPGTTTSRGGKNRTTWASTHKILQKPRGGHG